MPLRPELNSIKPSVAVLRNIFHVRESMSTVVHSPLAGELLEMIPLSLSSSSDDPFVKGYFVVVKTVNF